MVQHKSFVQKDHNFYQNIIDQKTTKAKEEDQRLSKFCGVTRLFSTPPHKKKPKNTFTHDTYLHGQNKCNTKQTNKTKNKLCT